MAHAERPGPASGAEPPSAPPSGGLEQDPPSPPAAADVKLGGYGVWDKESSNYVILNPDGTPKDYEHVAQRDLFPMDQKLAAGKKLRVRFGAIPNPLPVPGRHHRPMGPGQTEFHRPHGRLRGTSLTARSRRAAAAVAQQVSISSSPVGATARTTPSSVTVNWGAPISPRWHADHPVHRPSGAAQSPRAPPGEASAHAPSVAGSEPSTSRSWRTTPRGSQEGAFFSRRAQRAWICGRLRSTWRRERDLDPGRREWRRDHQVHRVGYTGPAWSVGSCTTNGSLTGH